MEVTLPQYDVDFWKRWPTKDLNFQLSPINWVLDKEKKRTIYSNHIKFSKEETTRARESTPCKLDVPYGSKDDDDYRFDVYGTDLPKQATTLFWVHGGYWRVGDKSWSASCVRNVYALGIRSIVINYPLAPKVGLADMSSSVVMALEKAMKVFPESKFIVGGHSAGAQLLTSLFHEVPKVHKLPELLMDNILGAFMVSGGYDMRGVFHLPWINQALQLEPNDADAFSSLLTVDKVYDEWVRRRNKLRIVLVMAEHDPPALKKQSEMYADMLRKRQFHAEYVISEGDDHYSVIDNMADENSNIFKSLKTFLLSSQVGHKLSKL